MKRNRRVYDPTGFQAIQNITDETRRFYKLLYTIYFRACTNELVERYQMDTGDDVWLCTQMLKRIGVDVEQWHKEVN